MLELLPYASSSCVSVLEQIQNIAANARIPAIRLFTTRLGARANSSDHLCLLDEIGEHVQKDDRCASLIVERGLVAADSLLLDIVDVYKSDHHAAILDNTYGGSCTQLALAYTQSRTSLPGALTVFADPQLDEQSVFHVPHDSTLAFLDH